MKKVCAKPQQPNHPPKCSSGWVELSAKKPLEQRLDALDPLRRACPMFKSTHYVPGTVLSTSYISSLTHGAAL